MSSLPQQEERGRAEVLRLPIRRGPVRAALVALRPRQWSKNLLLFAGILFAGELGDAVRWVEALAVFAAYCLASSAAYLANDVRDAQSGPSPGASSRGGRQSRSRPSLPPQASRWRSRSGP
jgi:hypothetical protein